MLVAFPAESPASSHRPRCVLFCPQVSNYSDASALGCPVMYTAMPCDVTRAHAHTYLREHQKRSKLVLRRFFREASNGGSKTDAQGFRFTSN